MTQRNQVDLQEEEGFNTASGMRSHVTGREYHIKQSPAWFQYRKRYEITCDTTSLHWQLSWRKFQYRKRYEITCDVYLFVGKSCRFMFQYRKRYEITCDSRSRKDSSAMSRRFNTASGMRSHVTTKRHSGMIS